jgi:signal transduction histidine kinase
MSLEVVENRFAPGSRTEYRLNIDPGLWQVNGDAGQLGQVIQNIVLNADQAMPKGGVVKIVARNVAANDRSLPSTLAPGNYVALTIEDNGVGIPEAYLNNIFDPYFTTKEKGSGLGLATSYSIIRNHQGQLLVESEAGKGSLFSLFIPAFTTSWLRPSVR